jgi:integrase/recombinase XerD
MAVKRLAGYTNFMAPGLPMLPSGQALDGPFDAWLSVVRGFLTEKAGRTGSRRTVESYRAHVGRFLATVGDPEVVTAFQVSAYAYGPLESGAAPSASTTSVRLAAVRGFYDFAWRMGLVRDNPAARVPRPRITPCQPRGLTAPEVQRLLAAIPSTAAGVWDRAIVVTAVLTGLRRTELFAMYLSEEGSKDAAVYRVRAKGGVIRRRELPRSAWELVVTAAAFSGRCLDAVARGEERLFDGSDVTFAAHLRGYAERAGLRDVTTHTLRHTAAKLRRDAGASIEDVSALLGHRGLATTAAYLRRIEAQSDAAWRKVASAIGLNPESRPKKLVERRVLGARRGGCWNTRLAHW